jgi:hypothetical protein
MQVMIAVKSGVIRRDDKTRLMIRKGVTTAHEGSEIVRDHPHLWGRLDVTFPCDDIVSAAAEDANLSHSQALRDLYEGLTERGYDIQEGTAPEDVPAQVVALALSAIDHPRGGEALLGETHTPETVSKVRAGLSQAIAGLTEESATGIIAALQNQGILFRERTDGGGAEPEPAAAADADPGETGGPGTMPDDVVDPSTKEGRAAIRTWAEDHGFEVSTSGPLRQEVLDAWTADQGGRG